MSNAQVKTPKPSLLKDEQPRTNKLLGWFVSYDANEKGAYYEIRAGRSFVTNSEIPGERVIVLESPSISTPHMALNASCEKGIVVQDIFSGTGTFLRKAGTRTDKALDGPVQLNHGDWIRIGERSRFQVCLVDGISA